MEINDQSPTDRMAALQQLDSLHAATTAIVSKLEPEQVLDTVAREMTRILNAEACMISEWDREKNTLRTMAGFWPEDWGVGETIGLIELPVDGSTSTHKALNDGEVVQWEAAKPDTSPIRPAIFKGIQPKSSLLLPMISQEKVTGLIEIYKQESYTYSHQEIVLAKLLAILAAIAIENARLFRTAQYEIKHRERIEERFAHITLHDDLTDLPNRSLFLNRLKHAIARRKRGKGDTYAVVYLDLDKFKLITDSLGHQAGDRVLVEISQILLESVREVDTVCRYGSDEFLILLDGIDGLDEALVVIERIQEKLNTPFTIGERGVMITASMGIVMSSPDYENPEEYIRDADIAMYHVKMNGKGTYKVFHPDMRNTFYKRLTLESDLRRAIQEREFSLHYQPIMDLDTNEINAFEALIRWETLPFGMIYPNEFIPLAEETGLIVELGYWIIEEACEQILQWQKKFAHDPPLLISVNISGKQLNSPGFPEKVEEILNRVGLDPKTLIFEITESVYIGETKRGGQALCKLKELGIQVHLDDFGTGYSALSYISEFPVDAIKIARSFVTNFNPSDEKRGLVHTIVSMAKDLNLMVVAEGIETPEQATMLGDIGCQFGQGYSFTRGREAEDLETYIAAHIS